MSSFVLFNCDRELLERLESILAESGYEIRIVKSLSRSGVEGFMSIAGQLSDVHARLTRGEETVNIGYGVGRSPFLGDTEGGYVVIAGLGTAKHRKRAHRAVSPADALEDAIRAAVGKELREVEWPSR